jgi:hypothetical protein
MSCRRRGSGDGIPVDERGIGRIKGHRVIGSTKHASIERRDE